MLAKHKSSLQASFRLPCACPAFVPLLGLINRYGMGGGGEDQVDTKQLEGMPAQGTECCARSCRHKSRRAPCCYLVSAGAVPNPVSLFSL